MNGILDTQTSGNDWAIPVRSMLHEYMQNVIPEITPARRQRSFLRDLEAQMEQFEKEYQAAIAEVRKRYVLPQDTSVLDFLNDHRALPQMLIDASSQLNTYFADTVFSLRASSDEYGWHTLYADAMWAGDAREILRLLDQFEDEWWIPNCRPARGALIFTYRLV